MPWRPMRYSSTPGSSAPQRVPIGRPSTAVKPMVVATLWPPRRAHRLAPLPRWAPTVRPSPAPGEEELDRPVVSEPGADRPLLLPGHAGGPVTGHEVWLGG